MTAKSKAWNDVELARTRLIVGQPFWGTLALNLELVEVEPDHPQIQTMATDGVRMYFNPKFVAKLDEEELKAVNAHETYHNALKHMSRRGHRDPYRYNVAGDFRINYDLVEAGFKLPGKPCGLAEIIDCIKNKKTITGIYMYDKQFAEMTTEEIYEKLPEEMSQPSGGGGRVIVIDLGGCGTVIDAGQGPGGEGDKGPEGDQQRQGNGTGNNEATAQAIEREWDESLRTVLAAERAKQAGNMPGYLKRLISQLKRPKVNWRDATRQFIDQSLSKDYTYAKPNRRSYSTGLMLPGTVPDALHELVGIIDISGSISNEMAQAMVSELAAALYDGVTDKLWIVYTDTAVEHVDEYYPGDIVTCQTRDGGGTDFKAVMQWVRKEAPEAAAVIFLTDMETCSFGEDPGVPTLWGCYNTYERMEQMKPPFGSVLMVESGT